MKRILIAVLALSSFLAPAASAGGSPTDLEVLRALFPRTTVHPKKSRATVPGIGPEAKNLLFPVHRGGLEGVIADSNAQSVSAGKYRLLTFQLALTDTQTVEQYVHPEETDVMGEQRKWLMVLGLIVVDQKGHFVSKVEGFPKEDWIYYPCMGDLCQFGQKGSLETLDASRSLYVFRATASDPSGSRTTMQVLHVKADGHVTAGTPLTSGECSVCDNCEPEVSYENIRIDGKAVLADKVTGPPGKDCDTPRKSETVQALKLN